MTDELALTRATAKATHARQLLEDELLQEAFKGLEDAYTSAWRSSLIDDASAREKLFLAINIVGKVRDHLVKIISDGQLASAELRLLTETAERGKRWENVK